MNLKNAGRECATDPLVAMSVVLFVDPAAITEYPNVAGKRSKVCDTRMLGFGVWIPVREARPRGRVLRIQCTAKKVLVVRASCEGHNYSVTDNNARSIARTPSLLAWWFVDQSPARRLKPLNGTYSTLVVDFNQNKTNQSISWFHLAG